MSWRTAARGVAHRAGLLDAWHRLRHRDTLTVLTFHRVLPEGEIARRGADPMYTLSAPVFAAILAFLRRHYRVVDLNAVLAARRGEARLPPFALLLTFDDGWLDNRDHAAPVLDAAGLPAVIFAAAGALQETGPWWQEVLLWAVRSGQASIADLLALADDGAVGPATDPDPALALLLRYAGLPASRRDALLATFRQALVERQPGRQMIEPADFAVLRARGIVIGTHGASHLPLTRLADPAADLGFAREWLTRNGAAEGASALAFPHGRYSEPVMEAARRVGFQVMFSSDPVLNDCSGGRLASDLLGRITMPAQNICDSTGRLSPARLSTWLFLRRRAQLGSPPCGR